MPGLYQSAYSAASNAVFVTSAVGRPPVTQSQLLKLDPKSLKVIKAITPAQVPGSTNGAVYAVYGVGVDDANGNVWVTNTRQNSIAVYRQKDLSLVHQFPVDTVPHARDVVVDGTTARCSLRPPVRTTCRCLMRRRSGTAAGDAGVRRG